MFHGHSNQFGAARQEPRFALSGHRFFVFVPSGLVLRARGQNLHKGVLGRFEFILRFDGVLRSIRGFRSVEVLHGGGSFFAKGRAFAAILDGLHLPCGIFGREVHWDFL